MAIAAGIQALEHAGRIEHANAERGPGRRGFEHIVQERRGRETSPAPTETGATFARLCRDLQTRNQVLDRIIEAARGGRKFSPQELLALQADIYQFVESTALVSKAAEQTASGLHRLWQLQV